MTAITPGRGRKPPLTVLHVLPAVARRYGGPSVAIFQMCRALRACGVAPLVATTDADGGGHLEVELGRVQPYQGTPTIFFPRQFGGGFRSARLARWLDAHVAEFDLVHVHEVFPHSSLAAARVSSRHDVPYIVQPHGTLDPWGLRRKRFRKQAFMHLFGTRLLNNAAAIHYTADAEKRLAEATLNLRQRGVVVPLGVPDEAFSDNARQDRAASSDPYLVALCRLDPKKGLDLLIRAFSDLGTERDGPSWRLVIAGDGDPGYVATLKRLARTMGLASRVSFPGWVSGPSKLALLRGASLFVLPSHQENFGISIVEAMACGVPVVVTPGVNIAHDIEGAGAGWITECDVSSVRDALRSALTDPDECGRRGAAARVLAERFRWSTVVHQLIAGYRDAHSA